MKHKIKSLLFIIIACLHNLATFAQAKQQPNIVIIMTDQLFADAMSCVIGNQYIHTPNIDQLAETGMRFTKAYSPNPLCVPMRTSMITGQFPHTTGIMANGKDNILDASRFNFMGRIMKDAGYETGYFGKWHIPLSGWEKDVHGFEIMPPNGNLDAAPAADFIKQKHEKPFFAFASFLSPHEVCQWARKQELPGGPIGDLPDLEDMPPLKTNFAVPENETDIMAFMSKSYHTSTTFPVANYSDADWRRLLWGYYRLVERADYFVGQITSAIKESGQEENTVIIFLADHGECAGSHHWNQKTVFYDESSRVPFIVTWPGKTEKGTSGILVNTGTDMIPTLCDIAGTDIPSGLPGKSLMAPVLGKTPEWKREFVVSENHMVQGAPVDGKELEPYGRMVRSVNYKYCLYSEGNDKESLVDMQFDPGELVNQAKNPVYKKILEQHRGYLKEHAKINHDTMALKMLDEL